MIITNHPPPTTGDGDAGWPGLFHFSVVDFFPLAFSTVYTVLATFAVRAFKNGRGDIR